MIHTRMKPKDPHELKTPRGLTNDAFLTRYFEIIVATAGSFLGVHTEVKREAEMKIRGLKILLQRLHLSHIRGWLKGKVTHVMQPVCCYHTDATGMIRISFHCGPL